MPKRLLFLPAGTNGTARSHVSTGFGQSARFAGTDRERKDHPFPSSLPPLRRREGSICLNGTDIRKPRLSDLRAHVGLVTQDVQLFQASVRDNLTLFDPSIHDDRVLAGLHALGLDVWFESLPAGLDTQMPPGGGGLSAGEAQLVAFARAFLKDPGLLILDEASSRLDAATERRLERAMDVLLRNRTAIIIATSSVDCATCRLKL